MIQELYTPRGAVAMDKYPSTPRRLCLIGLPGVGKTFAALTFPNPIVADLDNKLLGYRQSNPDSKFLAMPFWNMEFCSVFCKCTNAGYGKPNNPKYPPNARDALKYWLLEEGPKLSKDTTFILDSWTSLQTAFDIQTNLPHEITFSPTTGKEDGFAFWKKKKQYSKEIIESIKSLSCNVVVICHETYERNDNGNIIGVKALMDGSYADELPSAFTDVYRQKILTKDDALLLKLKQDGNVGYYWQTCKDSKFQIACKSIPNLPDYVPANYASLTI